MRTLRVLVPGAALLVAALTAGCAPAPTASDVAPAGASARVDAERVRSAAVLQPSAATERVLTPRPAATPRTDPTVVAAGEVAVDTAALPAPPRPGAPARAGRVTLDLLGKAVGVDLVPAAVAEGPATWHGTPAGGGTAVLVAGEGGALAGTVDTPDGFYRLTAQEGGVSRVERIDRDAFPEGDGHVTSDSHGTETFRSDDGTVAEVIADGGRASSVAPSATRFAAAIRVQAARAVAVAADPAPVVDVLVGYSTAAKNARGGRTAIEADIALAIAQTNEAFSGSGVQARVQLTHAIEVPDNGDVTGANLGRLRTADGWNDGVFAQREADGADLVSLIVDDTANQACGVAYVDQNPGPSFESYAFSLVDTFCATGNYTFTHELGHNFGAAHDRGAWSGTPAYPHGYGYVNSAGNFRTVMAYANACPSCGRILRFSNPAVLWNGRPTGVAIGSPNAADNASLISTTAPATASFRGTAQPGPTVSVAAVGTVVATNSTEIRWTTTGSPGPSFTVELLSAVGKVTTLAKTVAPSDGRFVWDTSKAVPGTGWTVRVRSTTLLAITGTSAPFDVVAPSISLVDAGVSGSWDVGAPHTVSWSYTGAPRGSVRLELVREGARTVSIAGGAPVGSSGTGSYTWTPPATLPNVGNYAVRATLSTYRTTDTGPALALTGGPYLTVASQPSAATAGGSVVVGWSGGGAGVTVVRADVVHVATGRVVATIGTDAPATGSATWAVPASTATGDYRIRLSAPRSFAPAVVTNTFRVTGTGIGPIAVTGSGAWTTGTPRAITWTTTGTPGVAVKLELVGSDGRVTPIAVAAPLAAGSYTWTPSVRLPARAGYAIRATVVGNTLVTGTSAATLTLAAPALDVPDPATAWTAGTAVDVTWRFASGAPVDLRLVRDRTVVKIADRVVVGAGGAGRVTWRVPLTVSGAGWTVRASATENAAITATSAGTVTVAAPSLRLVAPATAASWTRSGTVQVSWAFGGGASAPVAVTLVGPRTFSLGGAVSGTSLSWTVPSIAPRGTYTLRVRPTALGTSAAMDATVAVTLG